MKRSKRLAVVLELSEQKEREAADVLAHARRQLQEDQQKLEEIDNYILEYEREFVEPGVDVRAEEIIRQRNFLSQLAEVKKQQEELVAMRKQTVARARECWHQLHMKKKTLDDLIKRCQKHERTLLDRAEEKMLDEWCTQSFNRKSPELHSTL